MVKFNITANVRKLFDIHKEEGKNTAVVVPVEGGKLLHVSKFKRFLGKTGRKGYSGEIQTLGYSPQI